MREAPRAGRSATAAWVAVGVGALILILLIVAQLVLPGIAEQRIRDRLAPYGTVRSVHVHAFPAIELLWHHAGSVDIALDSYRSSSGQFGSELAQAGNAGDITIAASTVDLGLLRVRDATLLKRGSSLRAGALVNEADLRAAIPFLQNVSPVASSGGTLTFRGTAGALGLSVSADATVGIQSGTLVVTPQVPFLNLAPITLFANPDVEVQSVGASAGSGGFRVFATGTLR